MTQPASLFDIAGKTALVTGGSRGIGLMIARGFVEAGAQVYISSRKAEVCDAAAEDLSQIGACESLPFDLAEMKGVEALSAEVARRAPKLDILVNNAGATWGEPIDKFSESGWDKVMDLNVKSIFFLTQKLLPQLRAAATPQNPARVLNIGSIDGLGVSSFENYSYGASKAAVHHLTRVLSAHLAGEHINVNAIAPGPFETKMMAFALKENREAIERSVPRGRIGSPEDMAGAAIFLCSRASAFVTGAVLPLDGGITARR